MICRSLDRSLYEDARCRAEIVDAGVVSANRAVGLVRGSVAGEPARAD